MIKSHEEIARETIRGMVFMQGRQIQNCIDSDVELISTAISTAVEEERERCAKISDEYLVIKVTTPQLYQIPNPLLERIRKQD